MKKMGKILPVEAVVGAAMLKNKGWLRGRICFENEVVYTDGGRNKFYQIPKGFGCKCVLALILILIPNDPMCG